VSGRTVLLLADDWLAMGGLLFEEEESPLGRSRIVRARPSLKLAAKSDDSRGDVCLSLSLSFWPASATLAHTLSLSLPRNTMHSRTERADNCSSAAFCPLGRPPQAEAKSREQKVGRIRYPNSALNKFSSIHSGSQWASLCFSCLGRLFATCPQTRFVYARPNDTRRQSAADFSTRNSALFPWVAHCTSPLTVHSPLHCTAHCALCSMHYALCTPHSAETVCSFNY